MKTPLVTENAHNFKLPNNEYLDVHTCKRLCHIFCSSSTNIISLQADYQETNNKFKDISVLLHRC